MLKTAKSMAMTMNPTMAPITKMIKGSKKETKRFTVV